MTLPASRLENFAESLPAALTMRDRVSLIEAEMAKHPPRAVPIRHHFAKGIYGREAFLPADTLATGHIHLHEHLVVLSQGTVSIYTADGVVTVSAPATFVTKPGTKNLVYAHTDAVWTTFHPTDETDVSKLEAMLVAKTEQDYAAYLAQAEQPKELTQCLS